MLRLISRAVMLQCAAERPRAGQAAIELALGSLIIIFLFVGGLFYLEVAGEQRRMISTLRGEAGVRAMTPGAAVDLAEYLVTWDNGPDQTPYTADDQPVANNFSQTLPFIANRSVRTEADWDHIRDLPNPTPIYGLHVNPLSMLELHMIRAEETQTVYIDAANDPQGWFTWLYGRDHVRLKHTVWMPVMAGPPDPDDPDGGFL